MKLVISMPEKRAEPAMQQECWTPLNVATLIAALLMVESAAAQTAPPITEPPRYAAAAPFNPQSAPASAAQLASMVPIRAGIYPIGSPAQHALADRTATPTHRVSLAAFRIDRTEVTNAQFAEFLNALPVKPLGTALAGTVGPAHIPLDAR